MQTQPPTTVPRIVRIALPVDLGKPEPVLATTILCKTVPCAPKENTTQPHGLRARPAACLALPVGTGNRAVRFRPRQPVPCVKKIMFVVEARIERCALQGRLVHGKANTNWRKPAKKRAQQGNTAHPRCRELAPAYVRRDTIETTKIRAPRARPDGIWNKRRRYPHRRA